MTTEKRVFWFDDGKRPNVADVDINQFDGASALDVRVLRTNGLETTEIFNERREF